MPSRPRFLSRLAQLFRPAPAATAPAGARREGSVADEPGRAGASATVEVEPPGPGDLTLSYAPDVDGDPDAGEVIWTWVPYDERDGRGKDRPVLIVARRDAERVYGVRLTSKSHQGDHDYLAIGAGEWDSAGRPSCVDVEQIYLVHREGMRREASVLDLARFTLVATALQRRYGWRLGD